MEKSQSWLQWGYISQLSHSAEGYVQFQVTKLGALWDTQHTTGQISSNDAPRWDRFSWPPQAPEGASETDRPVVLRANWGCGNSDGPDKSIFMGLQNSFWDELAWQTALELDQIHLFRSLLGWDVTGNGYAIYKTRWNLEFNPSPVLSSIPLEEQD